jgi:hypothetical protein
LGTICNLWYRGTTDRSEWTQPVGRLLLLVTSLLVLVMPVTERLFNWDHFLRGGQDVEFNLLAGLLFAAMVVLSMSGRMMQPLMMQPAIAAAAGSCRTATPRSVAWNGPLHRAASLSSRWRNLDDPAFVSDSCKLTTLRI